MASGDRSRAACAGSGHANRICGGWLLTDCRRLSRCGLGRRFAQAFGFFRRFLGLFALPFLETVIGCRHSAVSVTAPPIAPFASSHVSKNDEIQCSRY